MSGRDLVSEMRSSAKPPRAPMRVGGLVDVLFALVAVVAVASFGYFGFTWWMNNHAPTPSTSPPVAAAPAKPATTVAWTDADDKLCNSTAAGVDTTLPPDMIMAQRSVTEGFARLATAIECRLTHKPTRFCDPAQKQVLVTMINDYLSRADLITAGLGLQGAPMALAGAMFGGEMKMGSNVYDMQRDDTIAFMTLYHTRISKALQTLARDGIATPDDFGTFMGMGVSSAITKMFADVQPQAHVCA